MDNGWVGYRVEGHSFGSSRISLNVADSWRERFPRVAYAGRARVVWLGFSCSMEINLNCRTSQI
uniref:Uncharacterized protein n=1 Tax=Arundo donax TaxID=35708 RepID=A0A0A9FW57_ARUDO